jgi:hypothetical protein
MFGNIVCHVCHGCFGQGYVPLPMGRQVQDTHQLAGLRVDDGGGITHYIVAGGPVMFCCKHGTGVFQGQGKPDGICATGLF